MAKKTLTPEQIGAGPSEHSQQCAVFAWAALHRAEHPVLRWLHAIPNGGDRDRVTAGRMKAEGVRRGVSDMCLPVARGPYHGLYVELKTLDRKDEKDGGLQVEQVEFLAFANEQGYAAIAAYGWQHAVRVIEGYLGLGPFQQPAPVAMVEACSDCAGRSANGLACGHCDYG